MEEAKKIFIVDDDKNVLDLISKYLIKEGYVVEVFSSAEEVLASLKLGYPDMFILDVMMPGIDGYELCKKIRQESRTPIIMVSAKDDEIDKILGLELGSDDYLCKPFSPRELVVRVKTVFRRVSPLASLQEKDGKIIAGDLTILPDKMKVLKNETEIELTVKEFELLNFLTVYKGKVFNREQILNQIWGYDYFGDIRAVDDLVKRLRKKLKNAGSSFEIRTVWGYGYKVDD